jgi:hypothetical protein
LIEIKEKKEKEEKKEKQKKIERKKGRRSSNIGTFWSTDPIKSTNVYSSSINICRTPWPVPLKVCAGGVCYGIVYEWKYTWLKPLIPSLKHLSSAGCYENQSIFVK